MMVIALYGDACVGKTTVATLLGRALNCNVRHCGELIKERSRALRCTVDDLPAGEHITVDDETRRIAANASTNIIIEGRFLDFVLHDVGDAALICLTCSPEERACRYRLRSKEGSLVTTDAKDVKLRRELYGTRRKQDPVLDIDTSGSSAEDIADRITAWLRSL
jgi:cytidylate kinase